MSDERKVYPVRRATIEIAGEPAFAQTIVGDNDVRDYLERVRHELRRAVASGRCASVVLTVHQHAEGCDHE